ncbi:HEAT repeat domain-containing protein [Leptolyngbya sp. FACHB-321]|uniref:HEAT repeat domain-containing protein n=1 Tax=Leptolyngbya sp. FACHB-321 TaxID=2692807 RepID=UPI00168297C6|nr:HEAT repeat domain-containing protein [Leptolyngbya sp. FACHB-321]
MRSISALLRALQHPDDEMRRFAVSDLCEHHQRTDPRVLQALSEQLLQDECEHVREVVTESLGKLGTIAVPLLITTLNDADPYVRRKAAQQLGALGDERAIAPLIQTLQDDHQDVQYEAADTLLNLHSTQAIAAVIQFLQQHYLTSNSSHEGLIRKLLVLQPEPVVDLLLQALTTHPSDWTCQEAAKILAEVGDERAIQPLVTLFEHRMLNVNETAARALVQLGAMAIPALQDALASESPWRVLWASYALVQLGEFSALVTLLDLLHHPFWGIRQYAIANLTKLGDRQSVEPIIACLQDSHDKVQLQAVQALGALKDDRAIEPLLELAQSSPEPLWRSTIGALSQFNHPRIAALMLTTVQHPDPVTRYYAILALKTDESEQIFPLLVKALEDPDWNVRKAAIQVLGDRSDPQAVRPLIQRFKQTEEHGEDTITALLKLGKPAVAPLIAVLKTSTHERLRHQVILLLGQLQDRRAVPVLAKILQASKGEIQHSDIGDRAAAAQALGMIGDASAIESLIGASQDIDEKVVLRVAEALSQFKLPIVVEPLIQILQKWNGWHFAYSGQPEAVQAIAQTLAAIGAQRAIEPLLKVLAWGYEYPCGLGMQEEADRTGGGSPSLTRDVLAADQAIAAALTQLTGTTISDLLLGIVRDEVHPLRATAAIALGRVGDLTLVPVMDALQDEDAFVRRSAAGALGMMYDERAVLPLTEALQDAEDEVVLQAIESLRWLAVRARHVLEAVPTLCQLLTHTNWQIREAAARALSQSPDEQNLIPLVTSLSDPHPTVRKSVVFALRYLGDERAIAPVQAQLTDEDLDVRLEAIRCLGEIGVPESVEPLTELLTNPEMKVRLGAVIALHQIGTASAAAALMTALQDESPYVQDMANWALKELGGRAALD